MLQRYIGSCQQLGTALLRGIALGLGLSPDEFAGSFAGVDGSYWVSRRTCYYVGLLWHKTEARFAGTIGIPLIFEYFLLARMTCVLYRC